LPLSLLEHGRQGLFLLPLGLRAVALGVRVVAGSAAHLAAVIPENRTDELAGSRVPEHMGPVRVRGLAVVLAKLALPAGLEGGADASSSHGRGVHSAPSHSHGMGGSPGTGGRWEAVVALTMSVVPTGRPDVPRRLRTSHVGETLRQWLIGRIEASPDSSIRARIGSALPELVMIGHGCEARLWLTG